MHGRTSSSEKSRRYEREKEMGTRSISTRIKKESDQKQETKWKRGANRERGRQREKGNTCATRGIHVTERKKYQKEFIRENVQHIAFMREEKCGRKYAMYTVFACMCEQGKTRAQKTKYVRAKERCRKKKRRKRENIRDQVQRYSNPTSVFFHPRCRSREKRERRAINKNPHRELHIPRDAYRCIFVFLMGNV